MRLVLIGAPGSGKGTLASALHHEFGTPHISSGDIFRANMKDNTPLGQKARRYIENGDLVPDSITISMVEDRLSKPDCEKKFMLDGFPRTIGQAEELDAFLTRQGKKIDTVISLCVSDELIKKRISERRICTNCDAVYNLTFNPSLKEGICDTCGAEIVQREDDQPETVMSRLKTYYEITRPLLDYYKQKGLVFSVDGETPFEEFMVIVRQGLAQRGLIGGQ